MERINFKKQMNKKKFLRKKVIEAPYTEYIFK